VEVGEADLDDPRVFQAVQEYLAALEAGRRPARDAFLAKHADIASALEQCLAGLDLVHTAGPKLRESAFTRSEQPESLGDFRIVKELGRGGMGVVYEAVQLSLGRRVALKVLPFAAALDSRQLQRFKNEAQAAAHLHHPHIVPVYAVGCERGVHFYAMQLIDGQNLAMLIDARRGETGRNHRTGSELTGPIRPVTPVPETVANAATQASTLKSNRPASFHRTSAKLIAQAAEALDYAHQNGVVHRDIKPANLLIDVSGNLWITDFGLALFHTDAGLTQSGDLLGTLRYMSPEQAGGPRGLIDHRTDVYSLGATLYELLTLGPIFDGTDRQTLLNQIIREEPNSPRQLDRTIPLDLETIVLKAIGKHPSERYASARELADDLNRFLRDEPIRARRTTPIQRVRKWFRRHPSVPVAAGILLFLLTGASLVSMLLISREQEKTRLAYQGERQRAKEADERLRLAKRSVDEMLEMVERELAEQPQMQDLRRRLLESALAHYQEFVNQRTDDPEMLADLAATRDRIKRILDDLAELQGAGHLFLLNEPDVLGDLQATAEQREQIATLNRQLAEQRENLFANIRRLTSEEKRARFLELSRSNEAGVTTILRPEQLARVRQISLQTMGPAAFRDPAIVAALKLTPEQEARVRSIEADTIFFRPPQDRGRPGGPGGPGGAGGPGRPGLEPAMPGPPRKGGFMFSGSGATDKIIALLTPEQQAQWKILIGQPFVRRKPPFRGGPGGPFGPLQ